MATNPHLLHRKSLTLASADWRDFSASLLKTLNDENYSAFVGVNISMSALFCFMSLVFQFPYPAPQPREPTKTLKCLVNIRKDSLRFVKYGPLAAV